MHINYVINCLEVWQSLTANISSFASDALNEHDDTSCARSFRDSFNDTGSFSSEFVRRFKGVLDISRESKKNIKRD